MARSQATGALHSRIIENRMAAEKRAKASCLVLTAQLSHGRNIAATRPAR